MGKCISIMGSSTGNATVRSRGGVLSREGPFSEVPLYSRAPLESCSFIAIQIFPEKMKFVRVFQIIN